MDSGEAIKVLVAIAGPAGLGGVVIAWLGYKMQGKKPEAATRETLGLGPVKGSDVELGVQAITGLTVAVHRGNLLREYQLDREGHLDGFEEWVEEREMRSVMQAFRAEQKRKGASPS